jgi:aryl-alcohol dehydrogenase-like predicted oxidoreductase
MRYVTFGTAGLTLSRLAFGCAPVMGKIGRSASLRAMHLAHDHGVTHFDVARSYGFGEAESVLAEFAHGRRDRLTIATKFGIAAVPNAGLLRLVKPLARAAMNFMPALRAYARAASRQVLARGRYDVATAQTSFEESLRHLRTDYVDILFIHEPTPDDALPDDLLRWLEQLRSRGQVRAWGLATRRGWTAAHFDAMPVKPGFVQCEFNVGACVAFDGPLARLPAIHHSPFGGADGLDTLREVVASRLGAHRMRRLSREDFARLLLEFSVHGDDHNPVLCSMFTPRHIRHNVDAVMHPRYGAEVAALRGDGLTLADLGMPSRG